MGRMKCQACKGASLREHERRLANPGPWNDWMDKSGRSIKVNRYEVVSAGAYEAGAKAANLQLCGSCAFSLIVSMHDDHADQMALVLTDKDMARARIWYERAAQKGNVKAMHNLAVLSAGRSSGGPDYATAARWFQAAAERGLRDSQYNLGILRENGLGVSKSYVKSYKWFALAAQGGDEGAKRQLAQVKKRMSKNQIARARKEISEWRAKPVDQLINDPFAAGQAWKHRIKAAR